MSMGQFWCNAPMVNPKFTNSTYDRAEIDRNTVGMFSMAGYHFCRLASDENGATAVEYGILAMLIAVALAGTMLSLGNEVETQYDTISTEYSEANK